jgi:hypothetical protein
MRASVNHLWLKALLPGIISVAVLLCLPAKSLAGPGWVLQQTSDYVGSQIVYLSPEGIKMVTRMLTTIILSPSQKVIMYNDKNKTFYESDYDMWKRQFPGHKSGGGDRRIKPGGSGTISGFPVRQYFFENVDGNKRRITEEYWTTTDKSIPAGLISALCKVSDLPPELGIPLRIFVIKSDGTKVTALDTSQCNRVVIPSSIFVSPVGYRSVDDPVSLILRR